MFLKMDMFRHNLSNQRPLQHPEFPKVVIRSVGMVFWHEMKSYLQEVNKYICKSSGSIHNKIEYKTGIVEYDICIILISFIYIWICFAFIYAWKKEKKWWTSAGFYQF